MEQGAEHLDGAGASAVPRDPCMLRAPVLKARFFTKMVLVSASSASGVS